MGCNYIEKKLHHKTSGQDYALDDVKGKSLYASVKKGYLNFHQTVSKFKPKRFKMDFLPNQKFSTFDEGSLGQSRLYEKGVYQYKKQSPNTALLVINTYNKQLDERGSGDFLLKFNKGKQGTFTAKLYSPDSNDHYKQSGTFEIKDY